MRNIQLLLTVCLPLIFALPLSAGEKEEDVYSYEDFLKKIWGQDMKADLDAQELRSLANKMPPSRSDLRKMRVLILHAAAKKDASFKDLLKRPELRENVALDMVLSCYDYQVNKSEAALDHILAQLATEDIGADVTSIVVLSVLDEWDRSIRAFRKHFIYTDGAGGTCKDSFLATRAYLFPEKYAEMRKEIEAPVEWTLPLLPKKK